MPAYVADQAGRGVEAHRLGAQQGGGERGRVVALQPGARVDQVGEADRVRFGEPVAGEGEDLVVDVLGDGQRDIPFRHPVQQPLAQFLDPLRGALGAHRLPQPVRLVRAEPGAVDRDLHHLLLEQRHAEGLAERMLHGRVRQVRRLVAVLAPHVGVHRAALDRARPDQRDLDHQVVELSRPQSRQGSHLGARLDLEHPDRVGLAEHLVDAGILLRNRVQAPALAVVRLDQLEAVPQRRQHAQAEQVELDQAGVRAVVLVPLQHGAARHPRPLHRAHLPHWPVADHHPAGVNAQVPGQPLQLPGQAGDGLGDTRAGRNRLAGAVLPRPDLPGPLILLLRRVAERPPRVAQRHPRPVGDHVGDLGCPSPAVPAVDVLDDLFPAPVLDIQVNVRRAVPARRQEPLEQQSMLNGVNAGNAERIADRRVGC